MARNGRRRAPWAAVGGAALLALGGTAWLVWAGAADDGPRESWRAAEADTGGDGASDLALWVHDGVVARVGPTGVGAIVGHDAADGAARWRLPAPEGTEGPCAASERVNAEGVGVVLYHSPDAGGCTVLAAIDAGDGALLWSHDFGALDPALTSPPGESATVAVGATTVTVKLSPANIPEGFFRLDLASGQLLPAPGDVPGQGCATGWVPVTVDHADARLVTLARCADAAEAGAEPRLAMGVHDAETGEPLWGRALENLAVIPADVVAGPAGGPLVVAQGEALVAYSEAGQELWRLAADGRGLVERAVTDGVLVVESLPTDDVGDEGADESAGVTFEGYALDDGERLWRGTFPEGTAFLGADPATGRALLGSYAYAQGEGGQLTLSWLGLADGATEGAGTVPFPLERGTVEALAAFDAERFYLGGGLASEARLRAFAR
ncbi:PQQ-binding-like beta-propeller repeat protein [Streptomyces sp. 3MP-14]|uniref:PQQ-binding-like beta-propeller repeat protein n=1 Tax=Streptomyces mimosae TaxID=2586635 RepID=A0A5N6AH02_9ACTN|nr:MULTISPECIES: PQQ-binding-like beta-propeller repeat protein [Streptomyces]KAB8167286.1 PQQ-binding-like beta-propeller repeat protein [Streptomyces mimosae]KAB8177226.1 PQQ-binding-like beta-propeller repeat protein [Streptomyces sp. 3MP-14]